MLPDIPENDIAAAIDACAAEVLWECGVTQPPFDALAVAAEMGLVVTQDLSMAARGRFVRSADQINSGPTGTIVIGAAQRPEREQWAVAHEIGEAIAYRVFDRLRIAPQDILPKAREAVANRLATALLLPRLWFAADARDCDWDLLLLKQRYNSASHELIARRMLELHPPVVITVFDQRQLHWRRSNVTSRPPKLLPHEMAVWQRCYAAGEPVSRELDPECGLARVQAWPVHEPDWKREIVRSEIAEL